MAPLIDGIDFAHFGRAPARFDLDELKALNARTVHLLDFADVAGRLPGGIDAAMWRAIRPNLATVAEAGAWVAIVAGEIAPPPIADVDRAYLAAAAAAAREIAWEGDPWHALTGRLKEATGRKGRALFLPLRVALTGREHGPDMAALLPLIGRERALARLQAGAGIGGATGLS